jgi:hypothetical protein
VPTLPLTNRNRAPRRRRLLLACVAAAILAPAAAAAPRGASLRLESPLRAEISRATVISDSTLSATGSERLLGPGSYWGGTYTSSTGERVTVLVSRSYPEDPARAQQWADFLSRLVHGPELAQLTAYLAPLGEVQSVCGRDALACYGAARDLLVAPGDG